MACAIVRCSRKVNLLRLHRRKAYMRCNGKPLSCNLTQVTLMCSTPICYGSCHLFLCIAELHSVVDLARTVLKCHTSFDE